MTTGNLYFQPFLWNWRFAARSAYRSRSVTMLDSFSMSFSLLRPSVLLLKSSSWKFHIINTLYLNHRPNYGPKTLPKDNDDKHAHFSQSPQWVSLSCLEQQVTPTGCPRDRIDWTVEPVLMMISIETISLPDPTSHFSMLSSWTSPIVLLQSRVSINLLTLLSQVVARHAFSLATSQGWPVRRMDKKISIEILEWHMSCVSSCGN